MEGGQEGPTRILMGVNQSSLKGYPHPSISSKNAFDWTIKKLIRSRDNQDFKLQLLHVQIPDEDGLDDIDSIFGSAQDFKDMKNKEKIRGIHLLEYFVGRCNEIGVSCEAWIKTGDPKEVIFHEVKRVCPDILVVGSRGLGPFQRVFVGTVSEYCSKHVNCPVIVVKRKPEDTPQDPVDD